MSSCCISHYVVYIIFFLIWQFELLRRIFLEVKIKSGGYYRALAVASYREMSRVGHRILQISRYQIHLFLWSDFSKVLTHNSILLVIKCAFNSIVCIIKWLMVRVCVTTYAVVWFVNEGKYLEFHHTFEDWNNTHRADTNWKVQPSSDIDRLN